jgi:hypothetical protein
MNKILMIVYISQKLHKKVSFFLWKKIFSHHVKFDITVSACLSSIKENKYKESDNRVLIKTANTKNHATGLGEGE